jgi:hypothetical protein
MQAIETLARQQTQIGRAGPDGSGHAVSFVIQTAALTE